MAQGLIGGATSYEGQSIKDILSDINWWIEYTESTFILFEKGIANLRECKFWNKIPFNFQMTLLNTGSCQKTYLDDFTMIVKSINEDRVTQKEVLLLRNIGNNACDFNSRYGKSYKEDYDWKEYDNPDFRVAENLYAEGRDYFVTLQDAANASNRLSDYISTLPSIATTHIAQQVTGNMNVVTGINNGDISFVNNNYNAFEEESKKAIRRIEKLEDVDLDITEYIRDLLLKTIDAIKLDDEEKQEDCKLNYKGFLIGAGAKAFKIIGVLSSFASIASFFGITL